jgi:two-component system cell cycle sensor histidine kinase/response regulator CckA
MDPAEPHTATRILLVEDEAIIALDLRQRLQGLGYVVTGIAATGAEALDLAQKTSPTLVFMDITIQGPMDGIETAKALSRRMDVPIVFLTAHADTGTILRAKAARPYGYLVKPFEERELATTIETATYRHKTEAFARLLQQAIGSANVGIVVANTHEPLLPITMCNAAFERMTGYSSDEALGRSAWFLEGRETDANSSAIIRTALQEQRECQVSLLVYRKDGTTFWDDLALSPVRNLVGDVTHFLFFHGDGSARKHAETALFQSQKVEAIGQLAGGVAHDFNNILAVISGYCEMAQRQIGADHPAHARLDQIMKASTRAVSLTRQLLAFSRKQVLQPRPLDLNAIVADTHKMLGRLIGENIEVVLKPTPGLGTVNADPGQVEQIVLNLAINARDAMPHGGILTFETRNVDIEPSDADAASALPGRYVMLVVKDTGIGMTPEIQAKAFDPFFTTKPEGEGTGLGLSTVYGIVKQSGGYVWVASEPGQGATFRVYLPRVDRPNAILSTAREPKEHRGGNETILLVEDNASLRDVIRENLADLGYKVLTAGDGREAVAVARASNEPIHLLLTDVVMPSMGGAELARILIESRPDLKVVYMSGYTDGALSHQGVLGEGVTLIDKPFSSEKVARVLRESLDSPPQG